VALIVGFGLLRAVAPGAPAVLLLTFGIGIGLGMIQPVLSIIGRFRAPDRPALATGSYASGLIVGSTVAAAIAVPLAAGGDDWRRALGVIALAGCASIAAWLVLVPADAPRDVTVGPPPRLPWRSLTAWLLALVFGLQSLVYYGSVSWLPNVYVERGWTQADAAGLVALLHAVGLVATIGLPIIADRLGSRRRVLVALSTVIFVGTAGLIVLPGAGWLWAAVLGLSLGAVFPLILTLPVDVANRAEDVGAVAALMLLLGYLIAALGPVLLGIARDRTGDFTLSLWLMAGLAAALVAASLALSPRRLDRGIGPRPPHAPPPAA
jgi:MFS transporter, CP family, cyanate transporter